MAEINLEGPGRIEFKKPELWMHWKRHFERYRIASVLDKEDVPRQACVLSRSTVVLLVRDGTGLKWPPVHKV